MLLLYTLCLQRLLVKADKTKPNGQEYEYDEKGESGIAVRQEEVWYWSEITELRHSVKMHRQLTHASEENPSS